MADNFGHSDEMRSKLNEPMENGDDYPNEDDADDVEDVSEEDYLSLNVQLDALNAALDALENKNDTIRNQLVELLQSNREARQQIQSNEAPSENVPDDGANNEEKSGKDSTAKS